ncbi:MAG: bifunctional metallophosphatase/5'-nucleotidase [Oligosphaeraceae bacterium]
MKQGTGEAAGKGRRRIPPFLLWLPLLWLLLAPVLEAREAHVRILHTSDLHANLSGDAQAPAGLLPLATLLEERRREAPQGACLLVDTGDSAQGSLEGALSRGKAILPWLAALSYDAWVPGNHDFDFGPEAFLELARALAPRLLCGNLRLLTPAEEFPQGELPPWRLFSVGEAKVALVGMTASFLPHWFPEFSRHFQVESARAALARLMPEILAARPDLIVLALHQGWMEQDPRGVNEVRDLARDFPEVDLILGGHTHRLFPGRGRGWEEGPWYVQPGAHGRYFAQVDAVVDPDEHRLLRLESRLVEVTEETPPHPRAAQAVSPWLEQAREHAGKILAEPLPRPLSYQGRPGVDCPQSELFCRAMAEAARCPLALHGVLSREEIPAGVPLTGQHLFTLVPYENSLVVCQVTPEELAQILQEQWAIRNTAGACGIWGAEAVLSSQGARILSIGEDAPPVPGKRYPLVMNSHTAAGGGRTPVLQEILARPSSQTRDTGISSRQAVLQWLQAHPGLFPEPRKWLRTTR